MADSQTPATPAGNSGVDVQAITKAAAEAATKAATEAVTATLPGAVAEAIKPVTEQVQGLVDNQKALTEKVDAAKPESESEAITAEAVAKIVGEQIDARTKASQEEAQKTAARQATIDNLIKEKLGGNADLGKLLTGATDEELAAQADVIAAEAKKLKPDFGGAASQASDGGDTPLGEQTDTTNNLTGLSEGVSKFASSIQLPTTGTPGSSTSGSSAQSGGQSSADQAAAAAAGKKE